MPFFLVPCHAHLQLCDFLQIDPLYQFLVCINFSKRLFIALAHHLPAKVQPPQGLSEDGLGFSLCIKSSSKQGCASIGRADTGPKCCRGPVIWRHTNGSCFPSEGAATRFAQVPLRRFWRKCCLQSTPQCESCPHGHIFLSRRSCPSFPPLYSPSPLATLCMDLLPVAPVESVWQWATLEPVFSSRYWESWWDPLLLPPFVGVIFPPLLWRCRFQPFGC